MLALEIVRLPSSRGPSLAMIHLSLGMLEARIAPLAGGSIASFSAAGQDMLRPLPVADEHDPMAMACHPLVPFSGRIAWGRFTFEGRTVTLPPDPIALPHAIHGLGWRHPWEVTRSDAQEAMLAFRHPGGDWPWAFEARQHFVLDETALTVTLALINRSETRMPAALGLHPFFPSRHSARLTARLPFMWDMTSDLMPARRIDVPEGLDFARGRDLAPLSLDDCFAGNDGALLIEWSDRRHALHITRPGAADTIIYTPREHDFFCVEPSTHVPNGFNLDGPPEITGLRVLEPGEETRLACRFEVLWR